MKQNNEIPTIAKGYELVDLNLDYEDNVEIHGSFIKKRIRKMTESEDEMIISIKESSIKMDNAME